ncbi:MAG: hypothetical protein ABEJ76_05340 [Halanaeroarchaeum sp.]
MLEAIPRIGPRIVVFTLSVATTALGLAIAYIAYRGYRRGSRPMAFVAVGFVLVFGVPFTSFVGFWLFPTVPEYAFGVASGTSRLIGLGLILYGLWMPTEEST